MSVELNVSKFKNLPQSETYTKRMAPAFAKYAVFEDYSPKAAAVEALVKEWKDRHDMLEKNLVNPMPSKDELTKEFWKKVDVYIDLQSKRDEMKKMIEIYDEAISKSVPPVLDPNTVSELVDLELITIQAVESRYKEKFTAELDKLNNQRKNIKTVYDKFVADLAQLKLSAKPLAKICNIAQGYGLPDFVNYLLKREPSFQEAVVARKKELAIKKAFEPTEEKKEPPKVPHPPKPAPSPQTYAAVSKS